jgi:hypothetical protein
MDEPRQPSSRRSHRIAAAFDSEEDATEALRDLRPFAHEIHVEVHLPGCHDVDEAERGVGVTMVRATLVAVPVTMLVLFGVFLLINGAIGDLSIWGVLAVAIGPGAILGILLGGIAGIAISQRHLEEAQTSMHAHRVAHEEEVLVAHVVRGSVKNPNTHRPEHDGMRPRAVVADLETQIRHVFEEHHGHLIDA